MGRVRTTDGQYRSATATPEGYLMVQTVAGGAAPTGTQTVDTPNPTAANVNSAASTNGQVIVGNASVLWCVVASNISASPRYLKIYNRATAPVVGTTVPSMTIVLPAGSTQSITFGNRGHRFGTGIGIAITAAAADTDTTAIGASEVKVNLSYT